MVAALASRALRTYLQARLTAAATCSCAMAVGFVKSASCCTCHLSGSGVSHLPCAAAWLAAAFAIELKAACWLGSALRTAWWVEPIMVEEFVV